MGTLIQNIELEKKNPIRICDVSINVLVIHNAKDSKKTCQCNGYYPADVRDSMFLLVDDFTVRFQLEIIFEKKL